MSQPDWKNLFFMDIYHSAGLRWHQHHRQRSGLWSGFCLHRPRDGQRRPERRNFSYR